MVFSTEIYLYHIHLPCVVGSIVHMDHMTPINRSLALLNLFFIMVVKVSLSASKF